MKFCDFPYSRVNIELVKENFFDAIDKINNASLASEVVYIVKEMNSFRSEISSMITIAQIRNSINTLDEFYDKEVMFYDENVPLISSYETKYYEALIHCRFRHELEQEYGGYWFKLLELSLKTFNDSIIEEAGVENKLCTQYEKILASAQIDFDGKKNNLSQMGVYAQSTNREIRKSAALKTMEFMESVRSNIEKIYDDLVHIRTKIAYKLGFNSFVELGYARLQRTCYSSDNVEIYRKQIVDSLVPLCHDLIIKQKERIKIDDLKFYDLSLKYLDGNPKPIGNKEELVLKAYNMYSDMSNETKEFFKYMMDHELLDLETKKGKKGGGYCTYIPLYKAPFIFSNFNGTSGDVDVLTHEAGHSFQVYQTAKVCLNPDLLFPTLEACEIHSMSMEFFAHPYMDSFFGKDANKYKELHLEDAITFIPYGALVDDFQHFVYNNPECGIKARNDKWRELEKKYTPYKDYEGYKFYEDGCLWFRQHHIFTSPFYYIDYTLAQVCALNFYIMNNENHILAWDKYLKLCQLGGTKSFVDLLKECDLMNPFNDGSINKMVKKLMPLLEDVK